LLSAALKWLASSGVSPFRPRSCFTQAHTLSELLTQGNNRQAVSDYIRQNYGQTVLHALTQAQLEKMVLLSDT
jgi:hypothetical protein